ncbi:MAG TPA: hypothetical protein VFH15_00295 [Pyrinomonadaceae bacterium]|nr:hypothetical protein [Pyrinomonadaceae bacterium]
MVHRSSLSALVCLLVFAIIVGAQAPADKTSQRTRSQPKAANTEEADAVAAQREVLAISLLQTLAEDARSFREPRLRARVQARVADAFWLTDVEKAKGLFRRAWEAAEIEDTENAKREAEDINRQRQSGPVVFRSRRPDLRAEVLRLAAKRDRALGEEFLAKLEEENKKDAEEATRKNRENEAAFGQSAQEKRLALARRLLEDGDVQRAMEFAGPALNQVSRETITFLSALRERNSQAADQGFLNLLAIAERDPLSDANTVSGLSSYAFTPFLYVTFSPDGGANQMRDRAPAPRPELPPAVSGAFFRVAANILLRPLPPPDQDHTTSGRTGKFMVIRRLLPLFEQYAPERAAELRTQMAAMAADVPQGMQSGENRAITSGITPDNASDPMERMQNRLDRARTSEERDAIYADVAVALAARSDPRARDLVDKIEDTEMRKQVRAYIDFQTVQAAIQERNAAEAVRIAKSGELTSIQRVWAYTRASSLLLPTERARALELLEAAGAEARRISGGDPDRARALIAVATGLVPADRVRAWETMDEAIKAANSAAGFTGEDSQVGARLQTRMMVMMTNASAEDFDLLGAFKALAREDLLRSVQLAKSLTGESPRAVATLAIARSVLEKPAGGSPGED